MIRKQLQGFVRTWNKHKIRRQRNRPHVIPGRPHVLYNYSQRPNQGDPIDTEYIKALNETTKGWKIHEYLPKTTIEFCKDILRREGFPSGRAAPANLLRQLSDGEQASLEETLAPLGGRKWKPTSTSDEVLDLYKEHAEDEDQLLELNELFGDMAQLDFEGDGVDEEAAPEEFYQAYVEDWEDEDD
ncbi:unnamed protein product [Zymoseptoria tritici ST99CH_1A5]|uniref:Uncharacterized protein n=1 Tax=Zymoseptoria tritici ST99CH_1A5 TaxID=1276529 RepID=A0A1Y6M2G6_ZYMTR|nr:unnamed protein product [Zymoseptoria tritici ST99CH_1A5]